MELKIVKCGHIIEIVKISEIAKIINSVHINVIENCQIWVYAKIVKISEIAKIINSVHINGIANCQMWSHYRNCQD